MRTIEELRAEAARREKLFSCARAGNVDAAIEFLGLADATAPDVARALRQRRTAPNPPTTCPPRY